MREVKRVERTYAADLGAGALVYTMYLDCGHVVSARASRYKGEPPKHCRCTKCWKE
jgi:hypothetical protein